MAYVIGDSCISCGSCEGQCPVGAISMGEGKFEIDAAKCVFPFPRTLFAHTEFVSSVRRHKSFPSFYRLRLPFLLPFWQSSSSSFR